MSVVGVRTQGDAEVSAAEVEALLTAHRYGGGAALPPVGTLTNNTPDTRAAWSRVASRPGPPPIDAPLPDQHVAAGPALARALGLAASAFAGWDGADHLGGFWATAMTRALWPVTWVDSSTGSCPDHCPGDQRGRASTQSGSARDADRCRCCGSGASPTASCPSPRSLTSPTRIRQLRRSPGCCAASGRCGGRPAPLCRRWPPAISTSCYLRSSANRRSPGRCACVARSAWGARWVCSPRRSTRPSSTPGPRFRR